MRRELGIGRALVAVMVMLTLLAAGCSRAKPEETGEPPGAAIAEATAAPSAMEPALRLRQATDGANTQSEGEPFTVTVDNCAGDAPLEAVHADSLTISAGEALSLGCLTAEQIVYQADVRRMALAAYGLTEGERTFEESVMLTTPAHSQAEYTLRWDLTYDSNVVQLGEGDGTIEWPIEAVRAATLTLVATIAKPCAASEASVPLVVGEAGVSQAVATVPPPGSDEAMALVKAYLTALGQGNLEGAYGYYHQAYQDRLSLDAFRRGYAGVAEQEIHSIDVYRMTRFMERAEVLMTLARRVRGEIEYADWVMTIDVSVDRGRPPYQRSISYVTMEQLGLE